MACWPLYPEWLGLKDAFSAWAPSARRIFFLWLGGAREEVAGILDPARVRNAEKSEEFGIKDQLQLARRVSVRPRASVRRGSGVGQGSQGAFPEAIDHRSALVPA